MASTWWAWPIEELTEVLLTGLRPAGLAQRLQTRLTTAVLHVPASGEWAKLLDFPQTATWTGELSRNSPEARALQDTLEDTAIRLGSDAHAVRREFIAHAEAVSGRCGALAHNTLRFFEQLQGEKIDSEHAMQSLAEVTSLDETGLIIEAQLLRAALEIRSGHVAKTTALVEAGTFSGASPATQRCARQFELFLALHQQVRLAEAVENEPPSLVALKYQLETDDPAAALGTCEALVRADPWFLFTLAGQPEFEPYETQLLALARRIQTSLEQELEAERKQWDRLTQRIARLASQLGGHFTTPSLNQWRGPRGLLGTILAVAVMRCARADAHSHATGELTRRRNHALVDVHARQTAIRTCQAECDQAIHEAQIQRREREKNLRLELGGLVAADSQLRGAVGVSFGVGLTVPVLFALSISASPHLNSVIGPRTGLGQAILAASGIAVACGTIMLVLEGMKRQAFEAEVQRRMTAAEAEFQDCLSQAHRLRDARMIELREQLEVSEANLRRIDEAIIRLDHDSGEESASPRAA